MPKSSLVRSSRAGFGVAPILYMLGLIGVGAGVLFSSYSQSLKANIQITNTLAAKNDLNAAETTLAATSVTPDGSLLCPPQGGGASASCSTAPTAMIDIGSVSTSDPHLPTSYTTATGAGATQESGIFAPAAGVKQLDPWGHYDIVCRWETSGSGTAFQVISAGASGVIQTPCGSATAVGDNQIISVTAATALNHTSLWQKNAGATEIQYGASGIAATATGNLVVPGSGTVGSGVAASGTSAPLLTIGKAVSTVYPYTVDQYGALTGESGTFSGIPRIRD